MAGIQNVTLNFVGPIPTRGDVPLLTLLCVEYSVKLIYLFICSSFKYIIELGSWTNTGKSNKLV